MGGYPDCRVFYFMEKYSPIKFYDGYFISTKGNAYSIKSGVKKTLSLIRIKNGYFVVNLYKKGKMKTKYIHHLVANSFIKKRAGKLHINHINGLRCDNRVENLEWCTPKENSTHAVKMGAIKSGSNHYKSIPIIQISFSMSVVNIFDSMRKAEAHTGIHINKIRKDLFKNSCVSGFYWRYKNDAA